MIGPIPPVLPQVASAATEPTQTSAPIRPVEDQRSGTAIDIVRAVRPIPDDTGQRGIEGAIAAKENTIRMAEEVARRDRDRLTRYPDEMAGLKQALASSNDPAAQVNIGEKLGQLDTALTAAKTRIAEHDATWPDKRAALETEIAGYRTQLARTGYSQL